MESEEKAGQTIYPPRKDVFNAFVYCPWEKVKVVIIGQDRYHEEHEAEHAARRLTT